MTILITGGAGYIGSHVVKALAQQGEKMVVLDNLSTGFKKAVLAGELVVGDIGDEALLEKLFLTHKFESVLHFAGSIVVPESVENPLKYYQNNTINSHKLLSMCVKHNTKHFIFSSTAAVYAMPEDGICSEDSPLGPNNPYGYSKLMTEQMIWDSCRASSLRAVALRYFNVGGADPDGELGQSTRGATSLIKVCTEAAAGKREFIEVFGTDYPTKDGTGVRDFIHVSDLASAHVKALTYLRKNGATTKLNCGYGHGFSVREVIDCVQSVAGKKIQVREIARRTGDYAQIIAQASRIQGEIGWKPQYDDLKLIVETGLKWETRFKF